MPVLVCLLLGYLIYKAYLDGRTDHTLAQQGIISPRLEAKYGDRARAKTADYGLTDYLADAWSDMWKNRTELRRQAVAAARTAPASEGRSKPSWGDRWRAAKETVKAVSRKLIEPVGRKPVDVPAQREPVDEPAPVAGDVDRERTCPNCGATLTPTPGGGWQHPEVDVDPRTERCNTTGPHPGHEWPKDPGSGTTAFACPALWRRCDGGEDPASPGRHRTPEPATDPNNPSGGKPVTAPTGEAVNYETTIAQLDAIIAAWRTWLDKCNVALADVENAKNHISDAQDGYRVGAKAVSTMLDHLSALHLDGTTLGLLSTACEAMPASDVDAFLARLEEAEVNARQMRDRAATGVEAAEAAKAHVVARYGTAHEVVNGDLSGDSRFLDGGGSAAPAQPVSAGV